MKTYYAIYRKSPTNENPWNVHLIVITENPDAIGEFVSPTAQREASSLNLTLNHDDNEDIHVAYTWYKQRTYLVLKIIVVNPYATRSFYFVKDHDSKEVTVLFQKEDVQLWLLENTNDADQLYTTFREHLCDSWETTLPLYQHTIHKVCFPIPIMT